MIPHGTAGKAFVSELARLFLAFRKATRKVVMPIASLLLQIPSSILG